MSRSVVLERERKTIFSATDTYYVVKTDDFTYVCEEDKLIEVIKDVSSNTVTVTKAMGV